jgi:hypothetical protein
MIKPILYFCSASLLVLTACGGEQNPQSEVKFQANPRIQRGFVGFAVCTGEPNLIVRDRPSQGSSVSSNKPNCVFGEKAYVEEVVTGQNGDPNLYARLPGWGDHNLNGRTYGYADIRWLMSEADFNNRNQKPDGQGSLSSSFLAPYYKNNYSAIAQKTKAFYPESPRYACAAFASTALKEAGFKIKQVLLTNDVEKQLLATGWTAIYDLKALRVGDVVFTDKSKSNVPGTYSHVYVFNGYVDGNTDLGWAIDNQGNGYRRNIASSGDYGASVIAYRKP